MRFSIYPIRQTDFWVPSGNVGVWEGIGLPSLTGWKWQERKGLGDIVVLVSP